MSTKRIGQTAERIAAAFLELKGYRILDTNYRHHRREIDLVATSGGRIVFVEVKCRRGASHGRPAEAVGPEKRRRIVTAARGYLSERKLGSRSCRFDVVEVSIERGGLSLVVEHVPGAFGADGGRW
jgi:putative endonuclease